MRIAYFNGQVMPEDEVRIDFRDMSYTRGDGCFDSARTFDGKPFQLDRYLDRFCNSLRYLEIDVDLKPDWAVSIIDELLAHNLPLLGKNEDYQIILRASRGVEVIGGETGTAGQPTMLIETRPIPFKARAKHFRDGIGVSVSSIRRTPPECTSPRVKANSYLNQILADRDVRKRAPGDFALLLDCNGNLAEGPSFNVFLVRDGTVYTPLAKNVLPGIGRRNAIEIAGRKGIPAVEKDLDLFDASLAEEMFITVTSMCIAGVSRFNGGPVGNGQSAGPVTKVLMDGYSELVGKDYVAQYLSFLD